jgi:hypothetical protein
MIAHINFFFGSYCTHECAGALHVSAKDHRRDGNVALKIEQGWDKALSVPGLYKNRLLHIHSITQRDVIR